MAAPVAQNLRDQVGLRIAEARRDLGLTQAEVAERLDVTTNYVARVEGGLENLTLDSLARIAEHLEVEVAELFERPASRRSRPGRPVQPKRR